MTNLTLHAAIKGIHGYVPPDLLTNSDLEKMVQTNDEWITTRTGIKKRHILRDKQKGTSSMAIEAVKGLLEKTNTDPASIDLLICSTITPDMITPATANIIAHAVGATKAFSYDLQAACSGFLYALVTGAQFIETGKHKKVIVVGADKMSTIVNYQDRNTCVLFGDGAGAVLLEPDTENGLINSQLGGDGAGQAYIYQKAGGSLRPASLETVQACEHYLHQEGKTVYRFAVEKMSECVVEIMKKNNLTAKDIKYLVPHQANKRILDSIAERINFEESQVMITIHEFGNTTSATIPLCLWRYEDQLKKGDNLIITTFGGGFTWGAAYLKWAYTNKQFID